MARIIAKQGGKEINSWAVEDHDDAINTLLDILNDDYVSYETEGLTLKLDKNECELIIEQLKSYQTNVEDDYTHYSYTFMIERFKNKDYTKKDLELVSKLLDPEYYDDDNPIIVIFHKINYFIN